MSFRKEKISDFCLVTDYVANGSFKSLKNNVEYLYDDGYAILVRLTDFTKNWNNNYRYVSKKSYDFLKHSKLHPGDLIMSNVGEPGRVFLLPDLGKPMTLGPNSILIRPDRTKASSFYMKYYFESQFGQNQILQITSGAAQKKFNKTSFRSLLINLPSLSIQQKIVEKLDAIFAEIDKATAAVETNINNAEALFQSYLRQVFEQDIEGWKKIYLKDIAEYFNGLTYSPKNVCENGTIVLRSSNIQKDKIDLDDIVRIDSAIKDKLYVKSGDILMCSRNGSQRLIGKTATIDDLNERMTFGTFMMIIRSDNNFFLKWFFKSDLFKHQITSGENTMINQITRYMLDEIVLSLPDVSIQKLISNKISNLYVNTQKLKLNYISKINEFSLIKQSILKQAFNGELVKAA
jgi:type I restriction enzyme S subunit